MGLIDRFQGDDGKRAVLLALREQQIVRDDERLAEEIAQHVTLRLLQPGENLIEQHGADNEMFFVLSGSFSIIVNSREVAIREGGVHVGEMALIDPTAKRSASVVAKEESVVAGIGEATFSKLAQDHPELWRRLALELGDRLRQRNIHVKSPNPVPVIFIASSTEGLGIANEIQLGLSHDYVVPTVWSNNVFVPGPGTMETLESRVQGSDFGVVVLGPEDTVISRGSEAFAPRDNVILELGMFLGAMGRERSYIVKPRGVDLKIPTDLLGLTPIDYRADDGANLSTHIGPVCTQIRQAIQRLGAR
jgi:predicted nucleotide-binding protein